MRLFATTLLVAFTLLSSACIIVPVGGHRHYDRGYSYYDGDRRGHDYDHRDYYHR